MKQILLIDIDSKPQWGNIAIGKIAQHYERLGYETLWNFPLAANTVEKIFVSCIFDWNKEKCRQWEKYPHAEIGGSGYDLKKELPRVIEAEKLKINRGFTTRGCIRNCWFCVVPEKEGKPVRAVGDIYDIWDGRARGIIVMDNNILALPEHFLKICGQVEKEGLKVDFNQGLDIRLLTPVIIARMKRLREKRLVKEYRFSWDDDTDREIEMKALFEKFGRCNIYVLVGHLPFERDLEKLAVIKTAGHNGYVMRLPGVKKEEKYIRLAQWVNQHWTFRKYSFEGFCRIKGEEKKR